MFVLCFFVLFAFWYQHLRSTLSNSQMDNIVLLIISPWCTPELLITERLSLTCISSFPPPLLTPNNPHYILSLWNQFLFVLYSAYKWYHTVFIFLGLAYFTWQNALQFHPYWYKWQNFFFNDPTISHIDTYAFCICARVYILHIFF